MHTAVHNRASACHAIGACRPNLNSAGLVTSVVNADPTSRIDLHLIEKESPLLFASHPCRTRSKNTGPSSDSDERHGLRRCCGDDHDDCAPSASTFLRSTAPRTRPRPSQAPRSVSCGVRRYISRGDDRALFRNLGRSWLRQRFTSCLTIFMRRPK